MKLVVGLGNPGAEYAGTRHNIGFEVIEELAARWNADSAKSKYQSIIREARIKEEKVLLIAPQTYMNRSGEAIWQVVKFYQVESSDLVVICDDMNLPLGRIRWRASGSAGGQKGLNDIIRRLGHDQIPRLRMGIGRPEGRMDVTSWVLGRFRPDEKPDAESYVLRAANSVEKWIAEGIESAMNEYNRDPS